MDLNLQSTKTYYYLRRLQPSGGDKKYLIIPFKNDKILVGRSINCDFSIADLAISRNHVLFKRIQDSWTVTNLSSNGVIVNGNDLAVNEECQLPLSSIVQICTKVDEYKYKFESKTVCGTKSEQSQKKSNQTQSLQSSNLFFASKERDKLQLQLQDNDNMYRRLLEEQNEITETMQQQKEELEIRYNELLAEHEEIGKQLRKETKEQLQDMHEKLNAMICEREKLEQDIEKAEQQKIDLLKEQEMMRCRHQNEKDLLEKRLDEEKRRLQDDMEQRVIEVKLNMEEQLKAFEDNLKLEQSKLSHEMDGKVTAEHRVAVLETEKADLEMKLERMNSDEISKMKENMHQMEQEMELMEFAVNAEKKAIVESVEEIVDSEMQCVICNDLFIRAILLGCSHTFCEFCINCWKKTKKDCPTCRTPITSESRALAIDNFIERIIQKLSPELRENRDRIIRERQEQVKAKEAQEAAARAEREARRGVRGRGHNRRRSGRGGQRFTRPLAIMQNIDERDVQVIFMGGSSRGAPARGGHPRRGVVTRGSQDNPTMAINLAVSTAAATQATATAPVTAAAQSTSVASVVPAASEVPMVVSSDSESSVSRSRSDLSESSESVEGDGYGYYGGYGYCYNCGHRGHWANGCPFR